MAHIKVGTVETEADLQAIAALRYRSYLSEQLIDARADRQFLDVYDQVGQTTIFKTSRDGTILGTIRIHILDRDHRKSATMQSFADILMPKVEAGLTIIDGARFAVEPDIGALRFTIARHTLRQYARSAYKAQADMGVAAVTEDRVELYRSLYGFEQISDARPYHNLKKPLVLLAVDLTKPGNILKHILGRAVV